MQNLAPGMTVMIIEGAFADFSGRIKSISDTEILVEVRFFGRAVPVKLASEDVIAMNQASSAQEALVAESPFHIGDTVFIHESAYGQPGNVGQVGHVVAVMPESHRCAVNPGEEQLTRGYRFSQLSLIEPERRPPDEDYLRAISHAVPMRGYGPRLTQWWQEQADKKIWSIEEIPDLHAAFLVFKAGVDAEIEAEIERQHDLWRQVFLDLTHVQKVEKWKSEWFSWIEYRSYLPPPPELTAEARLLLAIYGNEQGTSGENEGDEEHHVYHGSGPELRERCEGHMKHSARNGYAYDAIPFRPVSVDATSNEALLRRSIVSAPPSPSRQTTLLEREQALAALRDEEEEFRAALVSLASSADEQAVAVLLEKYADLESREGFDEMRWYLQSRLEIALLATQHEKAVLSVLHGKLERSFYSPYREQGIMLKGRVDPFFWSENPWQISAGETVERAIIRIWAPVARYAPRFVSLLCERIIGLALIQREQADTPLLAYLALQPFLSYELRKFGLVRAIPERIDCNNLLDWLDQGSVSAFFGGPPRDPNDDRAQRLPAFRLPLAMRELAAIHNGLGYSGSHAVDSSDELAPLLSGFFDNMTENEKNYYLNRFHMRNPGLLPSQFVTLAYDGAGNVSVFDRDSLDERLDPRVADWDHETWQVGRRESFWSWFDDYIPSLFGLKGE